MPAGIFLAIIAMTALSVFAIESNNRDRERTQALAYATSVATVLDRRANTFSSFLRAGSALFGSSAPVSQRTFNRFVDELRLDEDRGGVVGVGWAEVLRSGDADEYLESVRQRQSDFPDIRPPGYAARDRIAPVTYFAAESQRRQASLGFDLYAMEPLVEAMNMAKRTVRPTASGRFDLATVADRNEPGFIIFMPVYRADPTSRSRERALSGFLFAAFDAEQYLDSAMDQVGRRAFAVRLYEGALDNGGSGEPDDETDAQASGEDLLARSGFFDSGNDLFTVPVAIANRDFSLEIEPIGAQALSTLSIITIIFGLAIASLLMLVVRLLTKQALEDATRLAFYEDQQAIRDKLTRELNHRVKNTLANVLSMLALTRRRSDNVKDFANSLEGRIRSLSATHDLLTGTDWGTTPIRALVEAELSHFSDGGDYDVVIDGPDVELSPNDALSLGLAIHELGTNAAKFGALSEPGGSVSVTWTLSRDNLAHVKWLERGGPPVSPQRARGFGTELIEKIVAHELRHRVELDFRPEGVRCVIGVPVRHRSEFEIRASQVCDPESRQARS